MQLDQVTQNVHINSRMQLLMYWLVPNPLKESRNLFHLLITVKGASSYPTTPRCCTLTY